MEAEKACPAAQMKSQDPRKRFLQAPAVMKNYTEIHHFQRRVQNSFPEVLEEVHEAHILHRENSTEMANLA